MSHAVKFADPPTPGYPATWSLLDRSRFSQINQLGHGFKRIVDFMRDGSGHASGSSKFSVVRRARSIFLVSVMLRTILAAPITVPLSSFTGEMVSETSILSPSCGGVWFQWSILFSTPYLAQDHLPRHDAILEE